MATVYLARGLEADRLVAIKRPHKHLATDKQFLTMLLDEARVASAIRHPNVVRVRELGFEKDKPFIVLEYVEGCALSDLRKELSAADRAMATKVAVRIVLDALAGLHAAHELADDSGKPLGIIHRDISPHNVLVGVDGVARLTDFGIAKAEDRLQTTRTHEVKGKLAYLAPERIDKRRTCTRQSDVFSMGVVLWECLAGRRLFRSDDAVDTFEEVLRAPIPRLRQLGANIPPGLDEAVARALSRDLNTRHKSAAELHAAIETGARGTIASHAEVAHVVDIVFGGRLRLRHQQIRGVLGAEVTSHVLSASQLEERPATAEPLVPSPHRLASIAPAAPSQRYAFGGLKDIPLRRERRWLVPLLIGIGAGIAVGSLAIAVFGSHGSEAVAGPTATDAAAVSTKPPEPVMASFQPQPTEETGDAAAAPGEIELDDTSSRSTRLQTPLPWRPPHPLGTVHNGFTKLK